MATILAIRSHQQRGIGLLELMLAMVIIAIVTMMSMQYFGASKRSTLVNEAINEIQSMTSVAANMPDLVVYSGDQAGLTTDIALSGQIPSKYLYKDGTNYLIATPWNVTTSGNLSSAFYANVAVTTHSPTDQVFLIESTDLPNWACQAIVDKYQGIAQYAICHDGGAGDNVTLQLEFPLRMEAF